MNTCLVVTRATDESLPSGEILDYSLIFEIPSDLCTSPIGFTYFAGAVVPLAEGFCLPGSFLELLSILILSLFGPSQQIYCSY